VQPQAIKDALLQFDRTLLVADPRRCEPKKWVRVLGRHRKIQSPARKGQHPYTTGLRG
jgi:hypothetical protein